MKYYSNVFRSGNHLFVREIRDGKRRKFKVEYQPTLYLNILSNNPSAKKSKFRTPDGTSVGPIKPGSMGDCYKFLQQYKEIDNFQVYGNTAYEYAFINEEYPGEIEYNIADMVVCNLDIEVSSKNGFSTPEDADQEVTAITLKNSKDGVFHVFGCQAFDLNLYFSDEKNRNTKVEYHECSDELDLLEQFLSLWETIEPDILIGWNIKTYDCPYLINRISRVLSSEEANRLSPWGQIKETTVNIFNKPNIVYDIAGVSILDYLLLYRKNVLEPRENYRLDYIAEVELGDRKIDYGEYDNLQELYENNFQKFIEYNIHDVRLVDRIDAKRKLIELQLIVAYDAKVNFDDVLSQVRVWDTKIINYLLSQGVVVPQKVHTEKDTQFIGAYVMKPIPGMYEWIASFDVTSLYPTIMRTLNIGIETKLADKEFTPEMLVYRQYIDEHLRIEIEDDKKGTSDTGMKIVDVNVISSAMTDELIEHFTEADLTIGANAVFYRREPKSFYSVLIEELFNKRIEYKKKAKEAEKMIYEIEKELERRK